MAARKFSSTTTHPVQNPLRKNVLHLKNNTSSADTDRISMPIQGLRFTLLRLRQARSLVTTAVGALVHQNADADADIASVLQHSLGSILINEIAQLEKLLGAEEPE